MAEIKRRYDIGQGWMVEDDGYSLSANWRSADGKSGRSIGVKRPTMLPMPEQLEVLFSADKAFCYVAGHFAQSVRSWLGIKTFTSLDELKAQAKPGIAGVEYVALVDDNGGTYYRELLSYSFWKVSHEEKPRLVDVKDPVVQDYLVLAQQRDRQDEARFNEAIADSGRTLAWICARIGPWVPIEEIPVVELKDAEPVPATQQSDPNPGGD